MCDTDDHKRQKLHDISDVIHLPEGQYRAVVGLNGGDEARTYHVASQITGISVNTLYTHLARVRRNYPRLYAAILKVRKTQLKQRHRDAVTRAREHSRQYFRNMRKHERMLLGW